MRWVGSSAKRFRAMRAFNRYSARAPAALHEKSQNRVAAYSAGSSRSYQKNFSQTVVTTATVAEAAIPNPSCSTA